MKNFDNLLQVFLKYINIAAISSQILMLQKVNGFIRLNLDFHNIAFSAIRVSHYLSKVKPL